MKPANKFRVILLFVGKIVKLITFKSDSVKKLISKIEGAIKY